MTTPQLQGNYSGSSSYTQTSANTFNSDLAVLNNDTIFYTQLVDQSQQATENYYNGLAAINDYMATPGYDPSVAFMMMIYLFCNQASTMQDVNLAIKGQAMTISGDLNRCLGDMQSLVGSGSTDPATVQLLADEAQTLNTFLSNDVFTQALGSTTVSSLQTNLTIIRGTINTGGALGVGNDPTSGYSFYTASDNPSYLYTFSEYQSALSNPADPLNSMANTVSQTISNAFNEMTSTMQSWGASENIYIQADVNTIKTFQSFIANMTRAMTDPTKVAVQNQVRA